MASPTAACKPFVVPVFIPHAGCPHHCVFCDQTVTTGLAPALMSERQIRQTISRFLSYRLDSRGRTEISFYGGNFLGLAPERITSLLALAADYVYSGRADGIRFSTRPDTIDDHTLALIAPFPVTTIELGVQSMVDHVLLQVRRGHDAGQTRRAVDLIHQRDAYQLGLQIMVGLPGDSDAGAAETGEACVALAPDFIRIYPLLVLKGSALARWYARGRYAPLSLEAAVFQAKCLYRLFLRNKIKVVRMGLQPTEDLNPAAGVVAGPFHPAFGELVCAALWLDRLHEHVQKRPPAGNVLAMTVHPTDLSKVQGQKCLNIARLISRFGLDRLEVTADDTVAPQTVLVNGALCRLSD